MWILLSPFSKGSTPKGKNLLIKSNFFSLGVALFAKMESSIRAATTVLLELPLLQKWHLNFQDVFIHLKTFKNHNCPLYF